LIENPDFRLLQIKSLHDATIDEIIYDVNNQELVIKVDTKSAIDIIPLNPFLEIHFKTKDFIEKTDQINEINKLLQNSSGIIFSIIDKFNKDSLIIEIDYEIFINDITTNDLI